MSCEGNPTVKDRNVPVPLCSSGSPSNAAAQSQLPRSEVEIPQRLSSQSKHAGGVRQVLLEEEDVSNILLTCLASGKAEVVLRPEE